MAPEKNLFAPPAAPVADIPAAVAQVQLTRPRQVVVAVTLLGVSVGAVFFQILDRIRAFDGAAVTAVAVPLLAAWLTYKLWQGRNWARVALVIMLLVNMAAVGVLLLLQHYSSMTFLAPADRTLRLTHYALRVTAIGLLFTDPGRHWFRRSADINPPDPRAINSPPAEIK